MAETISFDQLMARGQPKDDPLTQSSEIVPMPEATPVPTQEVRRGAGEQISFDDLMNRGKARDIPASDSEDMAIDNGATLKKQDLFKRDNLNKIRNFMID